jgi:hypothetical protein
MGTRDEASLSPQERAALAGLEARAVEDDPALAARLAAGVHRFKLRIPEWAPRVLGALWFGPLVVVAGLFVVVVSLSVSVVLGVVGAALTAAGLAAIYNAVVPRLRREKTTEAEEESPS